MSESRMNISLDEEARKLVAAYYAYHSEDGECPCDVCEKARVYFKAMLKEADRG